jgi:L,D-peptidoglycan transpeptidase YkuD (ErfK/YbiS/YcfS/YnhG family)
VVRGPNPHVIIDGMEPRLRTLVAALALGLGLLANPGEVQARTPAWAELVPPDTTQVVRTVSSHRYCRQVWCTLTQAWERTDGRWTKVREFRSTIGRNGWGKQREGDGRSPGGVLEIKVTFTTGTSNPGRMQWRQRRPTSVVSASPGSTYNTWIEARGVTSGDRPSMRSGWVVDYNHVRLRPGVGPRPVPGKGSGIFYHTSKPGHRWAPTAGCTQVGNPRQMRWLLTWLRPGARPRIVQNR